MTAPASFVDLIEEDDAPESTGALGPAEAAAHAGYWPAKHDLFGVKVSATCYDDAVKKLIAAAQRKQGAIVDLMPVHGLVTAARDEEYRRIINAFDLVGPDGQPVRWALNFFYKAALSDRLYGPELMTRLCRAAAESGIAIYLYGSTHDVVYALRARLQVCYPDLKIAGAESPPFRELTPEEDEAAVRRINDSGAGILFIGTGCPRQEVFAYEHRSRIGAVQVCVGAGFDFHAGTKRMAPAWMQKRGLEWLFRLTQEPGRLWRRYLMTNSLFSVLVLRRMLLGR